MLYITDRTMQVSGILIPGLVKKVEVTGAAVIDAITDDNNVTLGYQANGYEPMKVNVDVLLEPASGQTIEDMAAAIQYLFKPPGQTAAIPLTIVNSLTAAHGLTTVFFKSISTAQKTESSSGEATLEFWEYLPISVQTQTVSAKSGTTESKTKESESVGITENYQEYLNTQRGQAPKIKDKTAESPASNE